MICGEMNSGHSSTDRSTPRIGRSVRPTRMASAVPKTIEKTTTIVQNSAVVASVPRISGSVTKRVKLAKREGGVGIVDRLVEERLDDHRHQRHGDQHEQDAWRSPSAAGSRGPGRQAARLAPRDGRWSSRSKNALRFQEPSSSDTCRCDCRTRRVVRPVPFLPCAPCFGASRGVSMTAPQSAAKNCRPIFCL